MNKPIAYVIVPSIILNKTAFIHLNFSHQLQPTVKYVLPIETITIIIIIITIIIIIIIIAIGIMQARVGYVLPAEAGQQTNGKSTTWQQFAAKVIFFFNTFGLDWIVLSQYFELQDQWNGP